MGAVDRSIRAAFAGAGLCALLASTAARAADAEAAPNPPAEDVAREQMLGLERGIDEVEDLIAEAHFRTAVRIGEKTAEEADALPATPAVRVRRAKLAVLLATAEVALGWNERACASMRRATSANPGLWLDERTTSPKVVGILQDPACRTSIAKMAP